MTDLRRLFAVVVLVVGGVGACSGPPGELRGSRVEIEIEIEIGGGQKWAASGGSVESAMICEGGSHRWVGYRTEDGSPIGFDDAAASKQTQPELVLIETQLGCADGSGAVSIAWEPHEDDRWIIVGGSGAYSGATGGGQVVEGDGEPSGQMTLRGSIGTE